MKEGFSFVLEGRYRMISPFLFSKKACQTANWRPLSRYAGRREDGACFRLYFICPPKGDEESLAALLIFPPNRRGKE
jgi:hypothetical protein